MRPRRLRSVVIGFMIGLPNAPAGKAISMQSTRLGTLAAEESQALRISDVILLARWAH